MPLFFYLLERHSSEPRTSETPRFRKLSREAPMAAGEGKAPTLAAEEHTLPPHEVPVENSSSEKSSDNSVAEVVPEKDAETPAAQDTTSVVEDKSETPEMTASSEKPEEEGSNAATEESNEAEEETIDEKPEIKIETAPADFRFPTTNQTRHCFTRYIEYHRLSVGTNNVRMAHSLDPCRP
uniref:Cytochrome c oxidase subunit 6b-1 n=1 Tax=Oryza nivara TaxID=4536 RepID=A0A0E0I461_ORYNI